ncbi:MAG: hypothetical protein B0D92_01260 [Spirochaeta sp. LUC14_002_19_P3]|nr:MAG: hypothetical protein B0D92_01260 [Spirochaeta sp. LUC14_002_19_P3]
MKKLCFLAIFFMLTFSTALSALKVPQLTGHVNDYANLLSASASSQAESYLSAIDRSGIAQIALLSIPSLEGESLGAFSIQVTDEWALGQGEKANGVLLLVSLEDKKIRIEVGYDLEGILTDAISGYIIRTAIVPQFKSGNYEAGILSGIEAIGKLVTGEAEISPQQVEQSSARSGGGFSPIFLIFFLLIFLLTRMGSYRSYRRRGISPGTALFMGMLMGAGSRGGYRSGGFGSSGGSFGGGFSGGFSGGGGFGGGGASGGW